MAEPAPLPEDDDTPIVIRADRAWEGDGGDVLHLTGNFEMRSGDWVVTAEGAEVYGPVEDPERLVVTGQPAKMSFDDGDLQLSGRGGRIIYRHQEEVLELYDDAVLEGEDISMTSSVIVYDLQNERLRSSGSDGVQVIVRQNGDDD